MIAVEVKDLWKKFRIYHDRSYSLKETLIFWNRQRVEDFWALKEINLAVPRGTTMGLIGRNGSGKSTLLKVVSRILHPTQGGVAVNGRVSTLLELGAGFHPDFTGLENIYLNASILGLSRKETSRRLEQIVEFAELGDFIDNPIRNYSSGMYVRLGFAVAVHVEPDILLVDEVLAVGDLAFQEKCLNRIQAMQERGVTIVLVSHSPKQVEDLCNYAVWLDQGQICREGPAAEVAGAYTAFMKSLAH